MSVFSRLLRAMRRSADQIGIMINSPGVICPSGYYRLVDSPEVGTCLDRISTIVGDATIYLMRNSKAGDIRERTALARFVDITPWRLGTRQDWLAWIVTTLLTEGNAFCLPITEGGELRDLMPMPGAYAYSDDRGVSYWVDWRGSSFAPERVLHFRLRPDPDKPWQGRGLQIKAQALADALRQASSTKDAYLKSDYKPSVLVSVDADEDLADDAAKDKIRKAYLSSRPGEPVIIPAGILKVDTIKPLTLADLSIRDTMELDKRSVAALFGVPAYMLGVGSYSTDEYNNFVRMVIKPICDNITAELTRKLLVSQDRYFRFSVRRVYHYDPATMTQLMLSLADRGFADGNETRAELDMAPRKGLDVLKALENYIPADMAGAQKKLLQDTPQQTEEVPDGSDNTPV